MVRHYFDYIKRLSSLHNLSFTKDLVIDFLNLSIVKPNTVFDYVIEDLLFSTDNEDTLGFLDCVLIAISAIFK